MVVPNQLSEWNEWSQYVLRSIERQEEKLSDVCNTVNSIQRDIGVMKATALTTIQYNEFKKMVGDNKIDIEKISGELKIKSGIWGLIAGLIPVAIGFSFLLLKGLL